MKRIKRVNHQEKKMKSLKRNFQREAQKGNPAMDSAMNSIRKEIEILKNSRHPNVVQLMEVIDDPTDNKVYLSKRFDWCITYQLKSMLFSSRKSCRWSR